MTTTAAPMRPMETHSNWVIIKGNQVVEKGTTWTTYCAPADLSKVAGMISGKVLQDPGAVSYWTVVVRTSYPHNPAAGPYHVTLDPAKGAYRVWDQLTGEQLDHGSVDCTSAKDIYRVLQQTSPVHKEGD